MFLTPGSGLPTLPPCIPCAAPLHGCPSLLHLTPSVPHGFTGQQPAREWWVVNSARERDGATCWHKGQTASLDSDPLVPPAGPLWQLLPAAEGFTAPFLYWKDCLTVPLLVFFRKAIWKYPACPSLPPSPSRLLQLSFCSFPPHFVRLLRPVFHAPDLAFCCVHSTSPSFRVAFTSDTAFSFHRNRH